MGVSPRASSDGGNHQKRAHRGGWSPLSFGGGASSRWWWSGGDSCFYSSGMILSRTMSGRWSSGWLVAAQQ
jgi:hypothetical protein